VEGSGTGAGPLGWIVSANSRDDLPGLDRMTGDLDILAGIGLGRTGPDYWSDGRTVICCEKTPGKEEVDVVVDDVGNVEVGGGADDLVISEDSF